MAETSSTITRHHLCTRLKEHSTLWAGNDGAVVDGTFFTIEIRVGFNWAEYWIDSYNHAAIKAAGTDMAVRMIELENNEPTTVTIGGTTYKVTKKVVKV